MSISCTGRRVPASCWRRHAVLGLLLLTAVGPLHAQRSTYTNFNAWFVFNGEIDFDERWGLIFDASDRRSGPVDETQAIFVRPGIAFAISPNVRVAVGTSRSESYPYGKFPNPYAYPEWRGWEQLLLLHSTGRVAIQHRYRLEQRWQGARGADTSDHAINHWVRLSRFRYQMKATLPLHGETVLVHTPYVTTSDELFVGWGKNVKGNVFDQNRAALAIGWRATTSWRGEVGYLNQLILKSDGQHVENNHTLTFTLGFTRAPRITKAQRPAPQGS
jgi:uncharacterized protein DUF2490